MAHFAELDNNNIVTRVIVVGDANCLDANGQESEAVGIAFCQSLFGPNTRWVQTSLSGNVRGKYAGVGDTYDLVADVFVAPPPIVTEPIPPTPSYTAFWDALLTSAVYGSIRTQSMASLPMNTLATEFIALLGDAKDGRPNEAAIQASMSAVFATGTFTTADAAEFTGALAAGLLDDIYSLS